MAFKFDIWQEGKYLDVWSIVHVLSGVMIAGFLIMLGVGFWTGFSIAVVVLILWEVLEVTILKVEENSWNILVDVLIGMLGYLFMWFFYGKVKTKKQKKHFKKIVWIIFAVVILLSIWGYIAHTLR